MIDYSGFEKANAEPEASSMIETFRAIGYSLESAIADIIDNSISAGAKSIWIEYEWAGESTTITVIDDGKGMTNKELITAMRPGSKNPLDKREQKDLGRFGLGLKTASFSQCKKFSVISKTKTTEANWWAWDLDHVNDVKSWELVKYYPKKIYLDKVNALPSGTAVVWWNIDRLVKDTVSDNPEAMDKFMKSIDKVKKHLSMVFHRFMNEGVKIFLKDRKIDPWDPFMIGVEGLQLKADVYLDNRKIMLKGFVLPHRSKLNAEQYDYGKGPKESWTAHQGFYVYRNNRLLVDGDWLGIGGFKKEIHYDLCRILIDLPNNTDDEWQIDIKKSIARPPLKVREQILSVAKDVRAQAVEVYRHKGKIIKRKHAQTEDQFLWEDIRRNEKRFYRLNRNHPILKNLLDHAEENHEEIEKALRFIEETIPVPLITLRENEDEVPHGRPFEGVNHDLIQTTIKTIYKSLRNKGKDDEEAKGIILNIEPFSFYPEYIESLNR